MGQSNSKSNPQLESNPKPDPVDQLSEPQIKVQWEWKSNPNPFSETEQAQWTPYNLLDNYLLEKAHYEKQKEVDLGGYIISIKEMLQKRKDNVYRQRPIRRNTEYFKGDEEKKLDQDEKTRTKRFFGAETPKTYNHAFGNLSDYLRFFQHRGPDIKEFVNLFDNIETNNNLNLLNEIVQPCLISCIQNESKKLPGTLHQKQYEKLFQETVLSIKKFYANILKAYTMEGFLYQNLNRYLRNEDWEQLDTLLPYAYCLCKAFFRSEFASNPSTNPQAFMTVYRGAQLDEVALSFYDKNTIKNFCWNSVTSTSRIRRVAENFMYYNFDPKKVPTLFIIEVPLGFENTTKWIDIKPYSAIPNEDEVVLPPGSVFELIKVMRNNQDTVEINLKLMVDVKQLAFQGQIMHGAMHSEMAENTRLRLVCLEGRELSDAITHLKGNRLIEELEFCLCNFDDNATSVLLDKIPKLKSVILVSSFTENETQWSVILKLLEKTAIEKLQISDCIFNNNLLSLLSRGIRSLVSLKSLILNLPRCDDITDEGLNQLSFQGFKYLSSLTSLALNFEKCSKITDEGLKNLCSQGLKNLTSLTSLTLDFYGCNPISDERLKNLSSQGLKNLKSLTSLTLHFSADNITDEGLKNLSCQGLKNLTSLTSLTLDFYGCSKITDEGLKNLSSQGLKNLTLLTSMTLDFYGCSKITDEGLKNFSLQGLKSLKSLTSLTLDFSGAKITDEGLIQLWFQGLESITSLTSLDLNFKHCDISDEGLNKICSQKPKHLASLKSLALDFKMCKKSTDEAEKKLQSFWALKPTPTENNFLNSFTLTSFIRELNDEKLVFNRFSRSANPIVLNGKSDFSIFAENILSEDNQKALPPHQNLEIKGDQFSIIGEISCLIKERAYLSTFFACLTLDFWASKQITDEGLKNLSLKHLTFLTSLTLNFNQCNKISDEGLNHLSSQGLKHLTSLTSLTLRFTCCDQITDQGLKVLSSQGLKHLATLTSFTIGFTACSEITGEGLNHLNSQGLKHLTSFTSLTLIFDTCSKITDEGLNHLSSLKYLASLTSFTLYFSYCDEITDEGLYHLSSLKYLASLTSLTLDFSYCYEITNEGLNHLSSQGLRWLTSLTCFTLRFFDCKKITGEGLNNLISQGLKYLTSLTSLTLGFPHCGKITDESLNNLASRGIRNLISLKSLILDFGNCEGMQFDAWENFCKVLKYLGFQIRREDAFMPDI